MASVVMMKNPLDLVVSGTLPPNFLSAWIWNQNKIVNAGAVEFFEEWNQQCECGINNADLENQNDYVQNEKGIWRAGKSHLYLTGRHQNSENPNPRNDGFYNDFLPFYRFIGGNWSKNAFNWTATSEVTQFSPFGFEIENKDALNRYSSAAYGYNYSFPLAVGANTKYYELAYDGFEDYNLNGCSNNEHFGFRDVEPGDPSVLSDEGITNEGAHTGTYSLKLNAGGKITKIYKLDCVSPAAP
jgi:hypothetical protein